MTDETTDADREELIARLRMYSSTDNHHSWRSICERQAAEALAAQSAEIERLKASKAHILEDAKQAREAVRQLREDDKATIDRLRKDLGEALEFAQHTATCALSYGPGRSCDCGLSALLSRKGDEQ